MIQHFNSIDDTLQYLVKNPTFTSGFVSGEGCFTAYLGIDPSLT
jgi:hypothetical protein